MKRNLIALAVMLMLSVFVGVPVQAGNIIFKSQSTQSNDSLDVLNFKLHQAAQVGNTQEVQQLLDQGAAADAKNLYDCTPLLWAAHQRNIEMVEVLLKHGANPNVENKMCISTPFLLALRQSDVEMVRMMLNAGADPKRKIVGRTPLQIAEKSGNQEVIDLIKARLNDHISTDEV